MPDRWTLLLDLHPLAMILNPISVVEPTAVEMEGKANAQGIRSEVLVEVSRMRDALGKVPSSTMVLIGSVKNSYKCYVLHASYARCSQILRYLIIYQQCWRVFDECLMSV
ncbi:hypothetical protein SUGI_0787490 [Cryptomeria japonica]|nr:hypothetical protein SUGI_0787490 [Cryptomeria japonica]